MTSHQPTPEQAEAIEAFATGDDLVIQAGAGTATRRVLAGGQAADTHVRVITTTPKGNRHIGMTPTLTVDIPITQIEPGQRVLSYAVGRRTVHRSGALVAHNDARHYSGPAVTARTTDGQISTYLPGHTCVTRWHRPSLTGAWLVYLMRRSNDFRIGSTAVAHAAQGGRHGLAIRITQENPDAAWILAILDNETDARDAEHDAQKRFDIPGWTFRSPTSNTKTQQQLDEQWAARSSTLPEACYALEAHQLDLNDPLWTTGAELPVFRTATLTSARNLITGMALLDVDHALASVPGKGVSLGAWRPIVVEHTEYAGSVRCLTLEGNGTYFADGLLTYDTTGAER